MRHGALDVRLERHNELGRGVERLVVTAYADSELLITPETIAFGTGALQESIERDRDLWLLTCWCSLPECAGVYEPIKVRHEAGAVYGMHICDWLPAGLVFEQEAYAGIVRAVSQAFQQAVAAWNERCPSAIKPAPEGPDVRR